LKEGLARTFSAAESGVNGVTLGEHFRSDRLGEVKKGVDVNALDIVGYRNASKYRRVRGGDKLSVVLLPVRVRDDLVSPLEK